MTLGGVSALNKLTDLLRIEVAQAGPRGARRHNARAALACSLHSATARRPLQVGYTECLTLTLCSHDELYLHLRRDDDGAAVRIANPKTQEFQARACAAAAAP